MNPLLQLLITEAPAIIAAIRNKAPAGTTSLEVIAAFEKLFTDSVARDAVLAAALRAEIASRTAPSPSPEG